jgi:hypothetical protein
MNDCIRVQVDGQWRLVDRDLFLDAHQQLADYYRAKGMTGDALDYAIEQDLPHHLALMLDASNITKH